MGLIHERQRTARGDADNRRGFEDDSFGFELFDSPVDELFFQAELGHAVPQQPANGLVAFEYGHIVSRTDELLSGGKTRWSRADYRNGFTGLYGGFLRRDPTFGTRYKTRWDRQGLQLL